MVGIMNDHLESIWKEAVVSYFKGAPPGETVENQENFHPGQSMSWLRLKQYKNR
jgi:hypothetical protein